MLVTCFTQIRYKVYIWSVYGLYNYAVINEYKYSINHFYKVYKCSVDDLYNCIVINIYIYTL